MNQTNKGHTPFSRSVGLVCIALSMGLFATACGEEKQAEDCFSNKEFFNKKLWKPVLEQKCFTCHNQSGQAKYTNFVLQPSAQTGNVEANLEAFAKTAKYEVNGKSVLLQKPLGDLDHKGGALMSEDDEDYQLIVSMLERLKTPTECEDKTNVSSHFTPMDTSKPDPKANDGGKVILLDAQQTVRRATLNLGGRLPTEEERKLVEEKGLEEAMPEIIENLAKEDVFHARIREMFNDMFLTDKYLGGNEAVDLLDGDLFPDARWYRDEERDNSKLDPKFIEAARTHTNNSVAREPLMLITHVVKNDLPFTEVLTADYMMVNPFTAMVYGVKDVKFDDETDHNEWKPGKVPSWVHAGILSSPMFLNRFPTTATNRNRHRSRMIYKFFLATDVMALAERPLDPTAITDHNPTLYNPQCTSCHAVIDPVAGALQNWDERGMYQQPEGGWYENMLPPGFGEVTVPLDKNSQSLPWLSAQITSDSRFATATVHNLYTALTGHEVINPLSENEEIYNNLVVGFEIQQKFFEDVTNKFIEENYNLKKLVAAIVVSPYYRTTNLSSGMGDMAKYQYSGIGTGRLLTPEMLHRKIEAVTGLPWKDRPDGTSYLLSTRNYRILYGGIDSDDVTQRITAANGIMANVQWRMANEMACRTVARDFAQPIEERKFFKMVERTYQPTDDNGFQVAGAVKSIKENIQFLHEHFLGEKHAIDSPEIEETYKLFYETWKEVKLKVKDEELSQDVPSACRGERDWLTGEDYPEENRVRRDRDGVVRAWMAVVTYLLADYKFLHE